MVQDILLKIIVFLLPTQLGLHFWPNFARLNGIRYDYYSPTLYLTDIFIFVYLFLNYRLLQKVFQSNINSFFLFLAAASLNTYMSLNFPNTFLQFLRLFEYVSLYIILSKTPNLWKKISSPFIYSFFLVVFIQLAQFILQRSLGGFFYYFGERYFSATTPNLPKLNINNIPLIRPSSIFSHPNSLAGYLILTYLILDRYLSPLFIKIINLLSLVLTFSKSALFSLIFSLARFKIDNKIYLIFVALSIFQLFIPVLHTGLYSFDSRSTMISNYLKIPSHYFIYGSGFGNYPTVLKNLLPGSMSTLSYLQPIHNLLLLLAVEIGIPFVCCLLYFLIKKFSQKKLPVILAVLVISLFDHYWLTIPQNKLILLLSLALFK